MDPQKIAPIPEEKELTSTDRSIHCPDTSTGGPVDGVSELDRLQIQTFLTTLAEVSLKIACRKNNMLDKENINSQ